MIAPMFGRVRLCSNVREIKPPNGQLPIELERGAHRSAPVVRFDPKVREHSLDRVALRLGAVLGKDRFRNPTTAAQPWRQEPLFDALNRRCSSDSELAGSGDGVDASRRHLCAKVTVSNCH
jgi:hypothetical protein